MRYGSLCSGIEAATVAWHPLGWQPQFFSEIEPFPCAVLAHHYPDVPNYGDMTRFKEWPDATIDVLVGGTPCQSFSVAGLRKGLADPRGNLMLTYLAIADLYRPRWLVWENVPGVLSSNGGRDFGTFLGGLGQLGYGFAYRVLDAQYFGVPQRRRRVFVVGYLGDWRRAAAVLFERHSLQGHSAPSRQPRETAPTSPSRRSAGGGLGTDFDCDGGLLAVPLQEVGKRTGVSTTDPRAGIGIGIDGDPMYTLQAGAQHGVALAFAENSRNELRLEGGDGSRCGALSTGGGKPGQGVPMVFQERGRATGRELEIGGDIAYALTAPNGGGRGQERNVMTGSAVRRLTPRECERLQGFPDDYTLITRKGKPAADGPRYKALGNSMAVPCMEWIGRRIQQVEEALS